MQFKSLTSWLAALSIAAPLIAAEDPAPFGEEFPQLDNLATGEWWKRGEPNQNGRKRLPSLHAERDEVIAFAIYAQDSGVLKMTAQLFPLMDDESHEVRLELDHGDGFKEAAVETIVYPGWSAHFRLEDWDATKDVPYRLRHGDEAAFEGLIRKDPIDKDEIVVGSLGCNSTATPGPRPNIVRNLIHQDPDLLYFSGDQTYHHTQHTAGWIQFGLQFREVMKDRPTICIPDDHDVGHGNLWGEGGVRSNNNTGDDGGYKYPPGYVNMVERQQTWNLPDAWDPEPIEQGIGVYFTRLRLGGIDFAILEDRKFKTGPKGTIPQMGPRADHINDPSYDRAAVDLPDLVLLGERQLDFLRQWGQDWSGAEMKVVLSQTAFCGAVHIHGNPDNRLLADLDSNAWPQTGRNKALTEIRRVWASHLCGDQHLAVSVKHGIEAHGDGPFGFTAPAIINTIYGRWWHPEDEKAGDNPVENSPLPWTGDYLDGLGNRISMLAYANPEDRSDEMKRSDGHGLVRYRKSTRETTFECWWRFADVAAGDEQFPGWPITFTADQNDGREVIGYLPTLDFGDAESAVVQVIDSDGEIVYTVRSNGSTFQPRVYKEGSYTVRYGVDKPESGEIADLKPVAAGEAGIRDVEL